MKVTWSKILKIKKKCAKDNEIGNGNGNDNGNDNDNDYGNVKDNVAIIISWVKFWREISKLICHFKCEITRLPWQPSVRLSAKMGTKF